MTPEEYGRDDYDGAWKEALETYFEQFMAFFYPQAHQEIDWSKGYEFLDKELQEVGDSPRGNPQRVDKLVKVWRREGDEVWVLVHIEVQSQVDQDFAERMYIYNYRLFDQHHRRVASFAVLGDENRRWRPTHYKRELWGCWTEFGFPVAKLLEYGDRWEELAASPNPFAVVVMAHLKAKETHGDTENRLAWKVNLVRLLYERGYTRDEIRQLYRFVDWLLRLPKEATQLFLEKVQSYEEGKDMTYITSIERLGIEKGIQIGWKDGVQEGIQKGKQEGLRVGLRQAIELGLDLKFGLGGKQLMPQVRRIEDVAQLQAIYDKLRTAQSVDEIQQLLPTATRQSTEIS